MGLLTTAPFQPLPTPGLNERRAALHALDRLQEEVAKLWIELRVSNGECERLGPRLCGCAHVTAQVWALYVQTHSRGVCVTTWMGVYLCVWQG